MEIDYKADFKKPVSSSTCNMNLYAVGVAWALRISYDAFMDSERDFQEAMAKAKKYQDRAQRYADWYAEGRSDSYIRLAASAMSISNQYYRYAIFVAQGDIDRMQAELDRINKEEG